MSYYKREHIWKEHPNSDEFGKIYNKLKYTDDDRELAKTILDHPITRCKEFVSYILDMQEGTEIFVSQFNEENQIASIIGKDSKERGGRVLSFIKAANENIAERQSAASRQVNNTSPKPGLKMQMCTYCSGTGRHTCSSCGGYGYHETSGTRTAWDGSSERYTERHPCSCSGGYTTCTYCGGTGQRLP